MIYIKIFIVICRCKKESTMKKNHMLINQDCCICDEIESGKFPSPYTEKYEAENRCCAETSDFIVFPSISPLAVGHILIFPKYHITSLSKLSYKALMNLEMLIHHLSDYIIDDFNTSYIFEHGVSSDGLGGCGITHAHLHVIPLTINNINKINVQVINTYPNTIKGNLVDLMCRARKTKMYILFGNNLNELYLSCSSEIPSQFMRRIIANTMGYVKWDWRESTGKEYFVSTLGKFSTSKLFLNL